MADRLVDDDFFQLFHSFRHTAFRLEALERYTVPEEEAPIADFVAGRPVAMDWFQPWLDIVHGIVKDRRRMARVRVLDTPTTTYQRFEMLTAAYNVEAGEEINYIERSEARRRGIPVDGGDWWLFDSCRLAKMHFDAEGRPLGAEVITDPATVIRYAELRDLALHYSTPYRAAVAA